MISLKINGDFYMENCVSLWESILLTLKMSSMFPLEPRFSSEHCLRKLKGTTMSLNSF